MAFGGTDASGGVTPSGVLSPADRAAIDLLAAEVEACFVADEVDGFGEEWVEDFGADTAPDRLGPTRC